MEAIKLFFQVGFGVRERVRTLSPAETSYMGAANGPFIVSAPSGSSRSAAFAATRRGNCRVRADMIFCPPLPPIYGGLGDALPPREPCFTELQQ